MTKKHKRESDLLEELQNKHGYSLMRVKRPADRYVTSFDMKTRICATKYVVQFAIPIDSALGEAMKASDKAVDKPKSGKRKRATESP